VPGKQLGGRTVKASVTRSNEGFVGLGGGEKKEGGEKRNGGSKGKEKKDKGGNVVLDSRK